MNKFRLIPFPTESSLPRVEISGQIDSRFERLRQRNDEYLSIEYQLQGDLNSIAIDPPKIFPSRQSELWTKTCFEFFIGVPGDRNYWEFNLSPSGDWNVFHLDDYRQGLRDETAFTSLPFTVERQANSLVLKLNISIESLSESLRQRDLEISVTTVIKSDRNEISYWALTHTGKEADFHLRDSFILKV